MFGLITVFLSIFKLASTYEIAECSLDIELWVPSFTQRSNNHVLGFVFATYIDKHEYPFYPKYVNTGGAIGIPREKVVTIGNSTCNYDFKTNVDEETNVSSIEVFKQSTPTTNCSEMSVNFIGDAILFSGYKKYENFLLQVAFLIEINQKDQSLFTDHIELYKKELSLMLKINMTQLKKERKEIRVEFYQNLTSQNSCAFHHCRYLDKLKYYKQKSNILL